MLTKYHNADDSCNVFLREDDFPDVRRQFISCSEHKAETDGKRDHTYGIFSQVAES